MEATETLPTTTPATEETELQKKWNTFLQHCLDAEVASVNLRLSTESFEKFKKETELKIEKFRYAAKKARKVYDEFREKKGLATNFQENTPPEMEAEVSH